ncbi:MAG: biopolymer transporter ExbD [Mangrovibacterium sp.]
MSRKVPEIPSSSLADIAFMLLIFFLVATTMDVDKGLERRLPPMPPEVDETDAPPIRERNVFVVLVNANNQLLVEGEPMEVNQLRDAAKEFMLNPSNSDDLPEKTMKEVEFFGTVGITKGVISLQNDRGTSYGTYLAVQNELVGAINELRDELSKKRFGKKFDEILPEEQEAVKVIIPSKISEAEPKQVGG